MKINSRYEIRTVIIELRDAIGSTRSMGDVYDDFEEFRSDHPDSNYKYGYIVYDCEEECIANGCSDWFDTPEEAMREYEAVVKQEEPEVYILCYEDLGFNYWEMIEGENAVIARIEKLCKKLDIEEDDILIFNTDTRLR